METSKVFDILIFSDGKNMESILRTVSSLDIDACRVLLKVPKPQTFVLKNKVPPNVEVIRMDDACPGEAINQLLDHVKSPYFQLLPAGDRVQPGYHLALSDALKDINPPKAVITGSVILERDEVKGVYLSGKNTLLEFKTRIPAVHTTAFVFSTKHMGDLRFDVRYTYADDIDYLIRAIEKLTVNDVLFLPELLTFVEEPGRSRKYGFYSILECLRIFKNHGTLNFSSFLYFLKKLLRR
jgi:hypothetical protein